MLALASPQVAAKSAASPAIAHLAQNDGRHALIVDGKPFTMLGVQAHNSSNYPGALDRVDQQRQQRLIFCCRR